MNLPQHASPLPRSSAWIWLVFITAMVVYGSLIPLDYVPLSWEAATERFSRVPWLNLNADKRADWVANGLAYFPIGALAALCLLPQRCGLMVRLLVAAMAATAGGALAVGVEFIQVYFPKRTVSLNDIAAEAIGGGLGALVGSTVLPSLWPRQGWWQRLPLNYQRLGLAYAAAVVYVGLFPFDLIISSAEWGQKWASPNVSWWIAGQPSWSKLLGSLALEIAASAPLALALKFRPEEPRLDVLRRAAWMGFFFGLALEVAQLGMVSTISQGISVVTRSVGFASGAAILLVLRQMPAGAIQMLMKRAAWLGLPTHLAAVVWLNGGLSRPWIPFDQAWAMLQGEVRFLPFYYHYFVTEQQAMISTVRIVGLYGPMGLWAWALRSQRSTGTGALLACAFGLALCAFGEWVRLGTGLRPDPSNLLIAGTAAAGLAALLHWVSLEKPSNAASSRAAQAAEPRAQDPTQGAAPLGTPVWCATGLLAILATLSGQWGWPFGSTLLLFASVTLVAWRPLWTPGLVIFLAMCVDQRPWAETTVISEMDVIFAAILATAAWKTRSGGFSHAPRDKALSLVLVLAVGSAIISCGMTLFAWMQTGLPWNAEPLGAIRAIDGLKGVMWAVAFVAWGRWGIGLQSGNFITLSRALACGAGLGLVGISAHMTWEWLALGGSLDLERPLRLSGPLLDMAFGGNANESLLILGFGLCMALLLQTSRWPERVLLLICATAGAWAILLTYTRAAHLALAVQVALCGAVWISSRIPAKPIRYVVAAVVVALIAPLTWKAIEHLGGPGATSRLQSASEEVRPRWERTWSAWALHDGDALSQFFGMGWARYGSIRYLFDPPQERVAAASVSASRSGLSQIILVPGAATSLNQPLTVSVDTPKTLVVQIEAQATDPRLGSTANFQICRKWMLNSHGCLGHPLIINPGETKNSPRFEFEVNLERLMGQGPQLPLMMALHASSGSPMLIRGLTVHDAVSGFRVAGSTDQSPRPGSWFTTSDAHTAWQIKNLPTALIWDRGALGVISVLTALGLLLRRACVTDQVLTCMLLIGGLAIVGLFDTPTNSGRFAFVSLMLLMIAHPAGGLPPTRERTTLPG